MGCRVLLRLPGGIHHGENTQWATLDTPIRASFYLHHPTIGEPGMIVFETGVDIRCRHVDKPQVAKMQVRKGEYHYIIIGTPYGHLHTSSGDVRTWRTASGAKRFLSRYCRNNKSE